VQVGYKSSFAFGMVHSWPFLLATFFLFITIGKLVCNWTMTGFELGSSVVGTNHNCFPK